MNEKPITPENPDRSDSKAKTGDAASKRRPESLFRRLARKTGAATMRWSDAAIKHDVTPLGR